MNNAFRRKYRQFMNSGALWLVVAFLMGVSALLQLVALAARFL